MKQTPEDRMVKERVQEARRTAHEIMQQRRAELRAELERRMHEAQAAGA